MIRDPRWKENASYRVIHRWVRKNWGPPRPCQKCGLEENPPNWNHPFGYFNWCMKHGTCSRNKKDWLKLCRDCHQEYDLPITRKKIIKNNTGLKRTDKTKLLQSISGVIAWEKRKKWFKMSEEQKIKISKSMKKAWKTRSPR